MKILLWNNRNTNIYEYIWCLVGIGCVDIANIRARRKWDEGHQRGKDCEF